MKMISNVFYLLASFSLGIAGITFFVERLNDAPNMPPASLALLVGGLLFLFLHNVCEEQKRLQLLNGVIFVCYFTGGYIL